MLVKGPRKHLLFALKAHYVGFELVHELLLFHIQIISLVDFASVAAIINNVVQLIC